MGVSFKNPEGYADPVPYAALSNMDRRYMPIVYICSPYSGDTAWNTKKARGYSRFAVDRGAIPLVPHLLLPQFLDEASKRELAMFMDIAILSKCKELWVFDNPTVGMQQEIAYAERKGMRIRYFTEDMKEEV